MKTTLILVLLILTGCAQEEIIDRESPITNPKITPQTDINPPKIHSQDYYEPEPLPYPINTAGAEDSPFIINDELYFFFTPDPNIAPEKQLFDKVTGIYVSKKQGENWTKPQRVTLQDKGKLALDGCLFVEGNKALFCSAREGYEGINWFTAEYENGWKNWKKADLPKETGELHIYDNKLYYHSSQDGNLDIWMMDLNEKKPTKVGISSEKDEGWPAISPDGQELWITKDYGIWRSKKQNEQWTKPELIISSLAGEATIDKQGNVYFVHHYFKDDKMLEADIYVARKK